MIFPPIELPQYIMVPPTDCEMKDIIGYHNKHLTGKISNYTAFFEKFDGTIFHFDKFKIGLINAI